MGHVEEVAPGIRRLTAPNPSTMTRDGTQTYLVGRDEIAVIDPGPDIAAHLAAVLAAAGRVSHVLITHAHLDHSAGAKRFAAMADAPVYAFGDASAGRSAQMRDLADRLEIAGGEGVDLAFRPDHVLADGESLESAEWRIEAVHTPGHMSNHLSFAMPDLGVLFSGDHVMGWSSTLISPPDGSLTAFMTSIDRLLDRRETTYLPGHGDVVGDGHGVAAALRDHRRAREEAVLAVLERGQATIPEMTARIYSDVPEHLHGAAARNLLAHVLDLVARGKVQVQGTAPMHDPVRRID